MRRLKLWYLKTQILTIALNEWRGRSEERILNSEAKKSSPRREMPLQVKTPKNHKTNNPRRRRSMPNRKSLKYRGGRGENKRTSKTTVNPNRK
jgi:hypothetical protein